MTSLPVQLVEDIKEHNAGKKRAEALKRMEEMKKKEDFERADAEAYLEERLKDV